MKIPGTRQQKRVMLAAAVIAIGWLAQQAGFDLSNAGSRENAFETSSRSNRLGVPDVSSPGDRDAVQRIDRAAASRESGFMVTVDARVVKVLKDDNDGSRHQRFLIDLADRRTLLVAHNIDLADRIPLDEGDAVRIRGQYEWNDRGGVLHWTHHDPKGRHPGGWIEHAGVRVE